MTALDFFYDEFVAFCNKYDLVEQFNKGLQIKGFPYELSCKPLVKEIGCLCIIKRVIK